MRSENMSRTLVLITIAAAGGCAGAPSRVVSLGQDSYYVNVAGARRESQADTNFRALGAANDYCGKMGKQLLFRQSQESGDSSWSAKREELTFVCTSAPGDAVLASQ